MRPCCRSRATPRSGPDRRSSRRTTDGRRSHAPYRRDMTVDLYWLPLGGGGRSVRSTGIVFEAIAAGLERRPRRDLYHSALQVQVGAERSVIEMAPVWS